MTPPIYETSQDRDREDVVALIFARHMRGLCGTRMPPLNKFDRYLYFKRKYFDEPEKVVPIAIFEVKCRHKNIFPGRIPVDISKVRVLREVGHMKDLAAFFVVSYDPGDVFYINVDRIPWNAEVRQMGRSDRGDREDQPAYLLFETDFKFIGSFDLARKP